MKIAYLTGEFPRATDTFIQREIAGLRAQGLEVITCSIRRTGAEHLVGPEQQEAAAETFHVLETLKRPARFLAALGATLRHPIRALSTLALAWKTAPKGLRGRAYNLIYFLEAMVLSHHLKSAGVTHLHNHIAKSSGSVAMLTGALAAIPQSFTLHGPDIFYAPEHWRLDEKIARARFVACISNFARAQAMNFSDPTHWSKLKIIHCGVDPSRYSPGPRQGNRLLFVGRLAAVKGVPVLFEALRGLPDLRLTLIGDGPERSALEAEAARLGLTPQLDFLGYRSQSEVAELLTPHDALVLPSFAEGVPVVLMEAMAAQLPVIATQVGGVSELVKHGESGLILPPGDPAALRAAIEILTSDADLRARMGAAGRAMIEAEFTSAIEAARLARLFREAQLPGETRPEAGP